jgi:CheY-like chemotaxis protein
LRWHRAPDLPAGLRTDQRRLRQVLLNLLANAVRFTDRGWVSLSVTSNGRGQVRFEVSDSGIGMSSDQLRKLFQRFEQVGDVEHSAGGTGLGLAISRNLVRLMGGDLQVTSSLGTGSTFWFELELNTTGHPFGDSGPKPVISGYAGPRRSVLVVDDVLESRALLVELLEPLGFHVAQAENGATALSMARAARPDLIVTDIGMPEMGGYELGRRLGEDTGLASVPVIVISATHSAGSQREREALAEDARFTKPIDTEELLVTIARLLGIQWQYQGAS